MGSGPAFLPGAHDHAAELALLREPLSSGRGASPPVPFPSQGVGSCLQQGPPLNFTGGTHSSLIRRKLFQGQKDPNSQPLARQPVLIFLEMDGYVLDTALPGVLFSPPSCSPLPGGPPEGGAVPAPGLHPEGPCPTCVCGAPCRVSSRCGRSSRGVFLPKHSLPEVLPRPRRTKRVSRGSSDVPGDLRGAVHGRLPPPRDRQRGPGAHHPNAG